MMVAKSPESSGSNGGDLAEHHLAVGAVDGDRCLRSLRISMSRMRISVPSTSRSMRSSPAPETQGTPHATGHHGRMTGHAAAGGDDAAGGMHAVDVLGEVSMRQRITRWPASAAWFSASSAVETTTWPETAPGEAGRPLATTSRSASGSRSGAAAGRGKRDRCGRTASSSRDQAFLLPCRPRSSGRRWRCACRSGSAGYRACRFSTVNSMSCMSR